MSKWQTIKTAPKDRKFIARVEQYFVGENDGSAWVKIIAPVIWDNEMETFTDILGDPMNKIVDDAMRRLTHWAEIPKWMGIEDNDNG